MADIPHVIFSLHDPRAGVPQIVRDVPYVRRHIATYLGGVREAESRALFDRFDAWSRGPAAPSAD